jgi:hypothetical protein
MSFAIASQASQPTLLDSFRKKNFIVALRDFVVITRAINFIRNYNIRKIGLIFPFALLVNFWIKFLSIL